MKLIKMFPCGALFIGRSFAVATLTLCVASLPAAEAVRLAWDPSPDTGVQTYRVHYGMASGSYSLSTNAGLATELVVPGLAEGSTYYFAVTAVGTNTLESDFSNEVNYTVPIPGNQPPTLNTLSDLTVAQVEGEPGLNLGAMGAGTVIWAVAPAGPAQTQIVNLSGIGTGGESGQALTVRASSSNPSLVPDPAVTYTSPATTGTLTLTPVAGVVGSAEITVTVQDDGGGTDTTQQTFVVDVTGPANTRPTLTAVGGQTMLEDGLLGPLNVSVNDAQTAAGDLVVTAGSGNPTLLDTAGLQLGGTGSSRSLTLQPVSNQSGKSLVTLTASDAEGAMATRSFWVRVDPVNDAPTLDPLSDVALTGNQVISLTGIGAGPLEGMQAMTVQATSSDASVVGHPEVVYSSPNDAAELHLTSGGAAGSAIITLTVRDEGGTANGGVDTAVRTFTVTGAGPVAAIAAAPGLTEGGGAAAAALAAPVPNLRIRSDAGWVVLTWDAAAGPYEVERRSGLQAAALWKRLDIQPTEAGTLRQVRLRPERSIEFFRLVAKP